LVHDRVYMRVADLPTTDSLRELRCTHLNQLIKVSGVITRRTSVLPMLKHLKFRCQRCNSLSGARVPACARLRPPREP
jgi:DNA replication licensing factor MCM2